MKIVFALARALRQITAMSQKPDAAHCFSRRVRQAVTPLDNRAFSSDAKRLLHNSASAALHKEPEDELPAYLPPGFRAIPYGTQS